MASVPNDLEKLLRQDTLFEKSRCCTSTPGEYLKKRHQHQFCQHAMKERHARKHKSCTRVLSRVWNRFFYWKLQWLLSKQGEPPFCAPQARHDSIPCRLKVQLLFVLLVSKQKNDTVQTCTGLLRSKPCPFSGADSHVVFVILTINQIFAVHNYGDS